MEIDNNNSYKIVYLSHLLLNNITRYLDTLNKIRFSFVCKRWYHERKSYLIFSADDDDDKGLGFLKLVGLKSFKSIRMHYDFRILKNRTLYVVNSPRSNCITIDQLERSKVKKLVLSSSIQNLMPGSLPSDLTELTLSNYQFPLESGDLPSSLKYLSLDDYSSSFSVGSLPPQLEQMHFKTALRNLELANDSVLPRTLTTIENCPFHWFKFLRNLPLLTTIISDCNIPFWYLEAGDLPQSLTRLDILFSTKFNPGVIPSSIKHLFLYSVDLSSEVLPRDAHFDYLGLCDTTSPILPGQLPPNIKEFDLLRYNKNLVSGSLPFGIVSLNLPSVDSKFLVEGVIPSSTKTLQLFNHKSKTYFDSFNILSIPISVEHLILGNDKVDIDLPNLPDSIKTLECRKHHLKKYNIESLKPSITTIKIRGVNAAHFYRIDPIYFIARSSSYFILVQSKDCNNICTAKNIDNDRELPSQWFKFLRNLPSLTTIVSDCNIPFGYLEADDLPQSLTRLELRQSDTKFKPGVIPSSIKHLF
ncbi:hypothetical protein PPL_01309 [Heterostelium album PN500]|uniref:F-box domain-containing protein n=1 Tax=Heterostelium pallidum (strain ATCC 26659 / Pp 5 / PN500) TaxID=670386 RepID=D3AYP5_HETP5|nr:hypothetical protein PPL_01309 [Heterostelium album PN500]EFA86072.1 hypothetical protein PPL_01309 [Heterostelium album PN500]|eukprot:XP_020438178.1 hypothetical protein PPL_01309 [Heterostelium album PN500]